MQLKKIQEYIEKYKQFLRSSKSHEYLYLWEAQKYWQDNFDSISEGWSAMYENSLQSNHTRRLWKTTAYRPKEVMLKLIDMRDDFVKQAFRDLLNEEKEILGRIDRFVFYCDQLLMEYKKTNPQSIENNHYQDYSILSLYLAFQYPAQYNYYNFQLFCDSLLKLGAMKIPASDDIVRYFKTSRTIFQFLQKDEEVLELHQKRLNEDIHYTGDSILMVYEFFLVMCR